MKLNICHIRGVNFRLKHFCYYAQLISLFRSSNSNIDNDAGQLHVLKRVRNFRKKLWCRSEIILKIYLQRVDSINVN